MAAAGFKLLDPEGDEHIVPLVVENLRIFVRPGTGDPVGIFRSGAVARAAGKGKHLIDFQFLGQQQCVVKIGLVPCGGFLIRIDHIAVAAERADRHSEFFYRLLKLFELGFVFQQLTRVAMSLSGITAAADLQRFNTERA